MRFTQRNLNYVFVAVIILLLTTTIVQASLANFTASAPVTVVAAPNLHLTSVTFASVPCSISGNTATCGGTTITVGHTAVLTMIIQNSDTVTHTLTTSPVWNPTALLIVANHTPANPTSISASSSVTLNFDATTLSLGTGSVTINVTIN